MPSIRSDVRFSLRVLASQPGFAATAILVLALGIGANAAVFSVVNAILLKPLPGVRDSGRIVGLYARHVRQADNYRGFSYPNYVDIREGTRSLEGVSAFTFVLAGVAEQGMTRRSLVMMVSANYFDVLGARPAIGRAFTPEEERPGSQAQVAVVSHAYWQRHGSDPALVGRTVSINGRLFTVVGIAPPGFAGTSPALAAEFWLPLAATKLVENDLLRDIAGGDLASRDTHRFLLFGRLKPGTARETANRELGARAAALAAAHPAANRDYTIIAHPLQRRGLRGDSRRRRVAGLAVHGPARHVRRGAARRLPQPGEHAAGARQGPAQGDRDPAVARRQPRGGRRGNCSSRVCCCRSAAARSG